MEREERAYWNRVAGAKRFTHELDGERLRTRVPRDVPLLDLGCGYGRLTGELAALGYHRAVGVDGAAGMLRRARADAPGLRLVAADGQQLPFGDAVFGAALLVSVMTCVPDEADLRALLRELRRVLAPGGVLFVSDLLLQEDERNRARYREAEARGEAAGVFELPEGVRLRHFPPELLEDLFAGFETLEALERDVVTMNGNRARGFRRWLRRPG